MTGGVRHNQCGILNPHLILSRQKNNANDRKQIARKAEKRRQKGAAHREDAGAKAVGIAALAPHQHIAGNDEEDGEGEQKQPFAGHGEGGVRGVCSVLHNG